MGKLISQIELNMIRLVTMILMSSLKKLVYLKGLFLVFVVLALYRSRFILPELVSRELASLDGLLSLNWLSLNTDNTSHIIVSHRNKDLPITVTIRSNLVSVS